MFWWPMERIAYSGQLALRQELCASCLKTWRRSRASTEAGRLGLQNSNRIQRRFKGYIAPEGEQARPITGFYAGSTSPTLSAKPELTRTRHDKEATLRSTIPIPHDAETAKRATEDTEGRDVCESPYNLRVYNCIGRTQTGDHEILSERCRRTSTSATRRTR